MITFFDFRIVFYISQHIVNAISIFFEFTSHSKDSLTSVPGENLINLEKCTQLSNYEPQIITFEICLSMQVSMVVTNKQNMKT